MILPLDLVEDQNSVSIQVIFVEFTCDWVNKFVNLLSHSVINFILLIPAVWLGTLVSHVYQMA